MPLETGHVDVLHGVHVPDPFRWLEDATTPPTQAWMRSQAELLEADRPHWSARDAMAARISDLLGAGLVGVPVWRGRRCFFMHRTAEQEHAVLMLLEVPPGEEPADRPRLEHARVLLDPMVWDPKGSTTLDAWQPSKEGHLLAYQRSNGGTEESELFVLDVASGTTIDGPIDRVRYSPVAWLPGEQAFCYVRRLDPSEVPHGEEQFHRRVRWHQVGGDPDLDVELFGNGRDPRSYYSVSISRDGRWIVLSSSVGTEPRNDVWIARLRSSQPPAAEDWRPVVTGEDAQTWAWVTRDGRLLLRTDLAAPRGRLCWTDPHHPGTAHWRELVREDPEAVLDDVAVLEDSMLISWTRHAVAELSEHDPVDGRLRRRLPLPGLGSVGALLEHPEGSPNAWFRWTDHSTPGSVLRFDAHAGEVSTWARPPGQVRVPPVKAELVTYQSFDGTPVRMFVYSPTGAPEGSRQPRPTILYGYGGFGISMTPGYSAGVLAWVEAGGVYAVACLRGGGEEGEQWHRAGMLANKQRVFDDFAAAGEWLIEQGWTTHEQLGISGGSNGGLLVGATITQRPDLARAAVCSAPLLDMVRYERFGLGATWNVEYGSAADPEQLGWLLAYSPYHHAQEAGPNCPAIMFMVNEGDTRVDPLHARKMAAALQAALAEPPAGRSPSRSRVLFRTEHDVGHAGRSVSRSVAATADALAFLHSHLHVRR